MSAFNFSTLLLEGPKFPSYNFISSATNQSKCFKINNKAIYLYHSNDLLINNADNNDHTIKTAETVWDTSLILSKYLEKQCDENKLNFKGKKVIEVGAGKSIPSLASYILGASLVTITDVPSVIPEIKKIIKLNGFENTNVFAKPLNWKDRKEHMSILINEGPWDYILAADVVWVDYLIEHLVDTISELSTPSHTTLFLGHQTRTTRSDELLFDALEKHNWKIHKISRNELNLAEGFWKDNVEIYQGKKFL
ncbi:20671_t:CDS:2 [Funneliformis geosporum]|uniref:2249_t:CDS:1 n=1 Tax=Funneliformis geosporum TaxID=1117311 RepID=A0A9W4SHP0_9GLOM|nr:2249_t:CDS:2 [Funneliformis geosporum]CAI2171522.1 20671_t:CDS:2 [Funneliformis geosporum]